MKVDRKKRKNKLEPNYSSTRNYPWNVVDMIMKYDVIRYLISSPKGNADQSPQPPNFKFHLWRFNLIVAGESFAATEDWACTVYYAHYYEMIFYL